MSDKPFDPFHFSAELLFVKLKNLLDKNVDCLLSRRKPIISKGIANGTNEDR
jgi:hypothetical protein